MEGGDSQCFDRCLVGLLQIHSRHEQSEGGGATVHGFADGDSHCDSHQCADLRCCGPDLILREDERLSSGLVFEARD